MISLILLLGVGVVYLCYEALAQSRLFQIAAIDIEGCERIGKKEILELSGVSIQSNLIKISRSRVEELVAGHRWVEWAEVARKWPDRLLISIRERKPVAIVNLDDGLYYIDKSGELFAALTGEADLDYPVISGLITAREGGGDRSSALREALQIIKYGG
ncbi:MAG: cell division protein FtsQ/DivIB, partial [Desulfurivibrionaceae bacterium]